MSEDASTTPSPTNDPKPKDASDGLASLDLTPPTLVRAVTIGALSYAVAWVAACITTVLALLAVSLDDEDVSWWWILTAPGQLVAMAFRSPAVGSFDSGDEDFAMSGKVSVTAVPLTILLVATAVVLILSRRDERRGPANTVKGMVSLAVASALTFVTIAFVIALVLTPGEDDTSYRASQFQLILFGVAALTVVALVGRRPLALWSAFRSIPVAALDAGRAALVHFLVFSALAVPAIAIYIAAEGSPEAILAMPVALINLVIFALTLGHLGALSANGFGGFFGGSDSDSDTFWLFSDDAPKVFLLLIVFAVVATLAAAVTLRLRHDGAPRTTAHWVWTPLVFAIAGGAMSLLATVSFNAGFGGAVGGGVSAGPAAWFLLVFAVWGAAAELGSRTIAPALVGLVPAAWQRRVVGQRPEPLAAPEGPPAEAAGTAPATAPPPAAGQALDARTKKILIGVGVLVALGIVAVIGISVANKMYFGPEKQAEAYFDALSSGNADDALDLVRLDYSSDERVLLTDDVLEASDTTISKASFGDVETHGDTATVTARYTIDGAQQSQELTLEKTGSRFGVFDEWKIIDPGLGTVSVTAPGASSLDVNGLSVDVEGLDDGVTLPAFPAEYQIAPDSGSSLLSYGAKTVTIGKDEESLEFEAEPNNQFMAQVAQQAKTFLDACIKRHEAEPEGCPNRTYWSDLKDVSWKLTEEPTYTVESDYEGGWTFSTQTPGSATVTATEPGLFDGDADSKYTDKVDISISGTVQVSGDAVTIEVDDSYF
ncbi:hypothetical protein [Aeromicrobium sp. Root236]|uniref:hypothetical protein n=1 Tax=Aeromicrobium sp. Root236 TaxID=1736498 RepID=UPI000A8FF214|nr:hypothetical protein [Aeromicrobium sp. Root236]